MASMKFKVDDGGRAEAGFKGTAGDCVCRAVTIASGKPYREVYKALAQGMGDQRRSKHVRTTSASARNGVNTRRKWFKDYMQGLGFTWVPTMGIGTGCKVHLAEGELPPGRLVVAVSRHYTAVVDGVIHDLYDPQREDGGYMFERFPGWETAPLKPGQMRNQNGIYHKVGGRCVYGYWHLTDA
jgi:hypothetical protein